MKAAGGATFSAQYQQQPIPPDGELVKWAWFSSYDTVPANAMIVQSWDMAIKVTGTSDYSVCMTFAVLGNDYYLLDVFRKKLGFPELKEMVYAKARAWRAVSIVIEDQGAGSSIIQQLSYERADDMPRPLKFQPVGDKVTRLATASPAIEQGRVHLPRRAPWLDDLRLELLQFPNGRHDDQVDCLSQFLIWVRDRERNRGRAEQRRMFEPFKKPIKVWDWTGAM